MEHPTTVVTGATGFIGRWLLAELTARGRSVVALARDAARRSEELGAFVEAHGGDRSRLAVLDVDLRRTDLGIDPKSPLLGDVRTVFHLAARMEFGLSVETARENNVRSTQNVARWAARHTNLERVVLLGGYRMTRPDPALRALESASTDAQREELYRGRGAYEVSKHEAYQQFRQIAHELSLPWTAVHPSSVIGDSRTGETMQSTGIAETARSIYEGRMPAMVGGASAFVPVVAVDHLARVLATVDQREQTVSRDLVVLASDTPPLHELVARLATRMGRRPPRVSLPLGLVRALPRWLTGVDREALDFIADDRYDTASADEHARAMGIVAPDTLATIDRWCDYLVRTKFLRQHAP